MDTTAPSASPLVLTPAEMAVIFQHVLGDSEAARSLAGDAALKPEALAEARATLVEHGLLQTRGGADETFLAPDTQALFAAVTRPRMLCVLQSRLSGRGEQRATFSWAPGGLVLNRLDDQGNHHLEPLPGLAALADRVLAECGLDAGETNFNRLAGQAATTPIDADALVQRATQRALFVMVANMGQPQQSEEAWSWLVSDGQLWLIAAHSGGQATMLAVAVGGLRELLINRTAQCAAAATS